jgi:hypothetical protein
VDDHTLVTYILTREQLIDPEFDLIHWFHIQQSENFHDMRQAPWWDSEGRSHHCTLQEDWQAYLKRYSDDSSDEDESASTSECLEMEASTSFEHLSDAVDEYDDLPNLQSISDSAFGDDRLHDFDDDEFADLPESETVTNTDDEVDGHSQPANSVSDDVQYNWIRNYHSDDNNAPGTTEELLDSSEGQPLQ